MWIFLARICIKLVLVPKVLSTFMCLVVCQMTKKFVDSISSLKDILWTSESMVMGYFCSPTPRNHGENCLSDTLQKIRKLEAEVDVLLENSCKMPKDKEDLLNAAVCRVDALEAELISTKKVRCYFCRVALPIDLVDTATGK